jgi:hypothetical protein
MLSTEKIKKNLKVLNARNGIQVYVKQIFKKKWVKSFIQELGKFSSRLVNIFSHLLVSAIPELCTSTEKLLSISSSLSTRQRVITLPITFDRQMLRYMEHFIPHSLSFVISIRFAQDNNAVDVSAMINLTKKLYFAFIPLNCVLPYTWKQNLYQ